jgi:N-acetyl-anhydromuramyl-L-alanine amidase AmpD
MPSSYGGGLQAPDTTVIHAMGQFIESDGRIYYAKEWLDKLGYSAHILVDPVIGPISTRDLNMMAWHAKGFNANSVGIEFLVPGVWESDTFRKRIETPYLTDIQYEAGVWVYRTYLAHTKVVFHSEIDERYENGYKVKVDPGRGFPKERYLYDIKKPG